MFFITSRDRSRLSPNVFLRWRRLRSLRAFVYDHSRPTRARSNRQPYYRAGGARRCRFYDIVPGRPGGIPPDSKRARVVGAVAGTEDLKASCRCNLRDPMHTVTRTLSIAGAAVLVVAGTAVAQANGIEFGETKTRFEIQRTLDARTMLRPWDIDWRHTPAWQQGTSRPRPYFAPPGCFIIRRVATPDDVALQTMYICR